MGNMEGKTLRTRRAIGGGIAGATAAAVVLASVLVPSAANALDAANPNDPSVAQGQIIQLPAPLLGGLDIASLGHTLTSNPAAAGPELGGLDVTALEALNLQIGAVNLPLLTDGTTPGLLQLGDLGSTQSYSSSPTQTQSIASSGTITSGGAIDAGAIDGSSNPGSLELTGLLSQLGLTGVTDGIIDEASVSLGALASRAESNLDVVTSEYRIADLGIDLHSDLVAGLATTLGPAVQDVLDPVSALAEPGGALDSVLSTVVNTVNLIPDVPLVADFEATGGNVSIDGLGTLGETVVAEVITEPLENTTGSVLVDLSDGTISVDLASLLVETGAGADLNSLPANTPVLSATTIAAIQQGITSALTGTHPNSLNGKLSTILETSLNALEVSISAGVEVSSPLTGLELASGTIDVNGSLAQFAGTATPAPVVDPNIDLLGIVDLDVLLDPVAAAVASTLATIAAPVATLLQDVVDPGNLQGALAALTGPLLNALDPVLQGVLSGVATITINEQNEPGDIAGDSFTVRALGINLLPGVGGGVELDLGSSTVKAAAAAVAAVDAADTVPAGTNLPVTGSGWPANTDVSIAVTAPGGAVVNDPVVVTTDVNGAFTTDFFVPATTTPGTGYTVTATAGAISATDTTEVTAAATVDAAPAVQQGTDLAVTGANWPANTVVSVQLTAPGGGAIGGPETATTDGFGVFTLAYPVPAGTPAAEGYLVTATAGAQTAADETEVTAAPVPTVDAADTVQAGTDLAVSGDTWPANTDVTLQLTAPGTGENVGGPITATTDGAGAFTTGYPVPASAVAGAGYVVTATAGAQSAIDTTEVTPAVVVDAADTAQAGTDLPITGANWPANTDVSVQLTGPGEVPVGDPQTVTTDGSGGFTLNYPVPADAEPGTGYTVTATTGTQTATDTTEITAAATIDAAPAVQAGTDLAVTGSNWPANTDVTVQLTAPGGGAIGGPETATTDGTGVFTLNYPVPAGTPAATGYTVTANVGPQTATDTTEVTAAAVPAVDAADTVQAGTDLAVSGNTWPANTEITLQLTAPGTGEDIGGPETVTTDGTGAFTTGYPVPASAVAGTGYVLTATAGAQSAIDTTEVTAAASVDAADTAQAGTDLPITGANWPANTEITVQLTGPGAVAVGTPQTVTTDGTGGFTLDYPVPATAEPGTGYTVTATAGAQTATDTTEITAAAAVDAADSAQAGADLPITGTNWPANTEITVQLTAPGGAAVGEPQTVTTDGTGGFTLNYPVPANAEPGTGYTVTATAGAQTATDTTEITAAATVDAADTVEAGTDLTVTGANWPANTEITVQLTAPGGATIGGPETVTTGALGAFTLDYPVPAGTPAGTGYTVTASAGTQTATDTTEVTAAAVVVDAAPSVPAGTNLSVTGSGWPINTTVTLQLTAPGGGADVGGPVDVTTDGFGAFATVYAVPADAIPATGYTITATAGAITATDTTEVSAGDPGDVNTNAAASASASADATADGDPSAQAAAEAAALADATSDASAAATADATAAAEAAATPDASSAASTDATSDVNASAATAAQAAAQADASDDANASASTAADANSAASSESAATSDSSTDASSEASANTNAAASASASADATADGDPSAQAAAEASAFADATSTASAAADASAESAAEAAALTAASADASTTSTSDANAQAAVAAQAAAQADASDDTNASASAVADANSSTAAQAAAVANSSDDASADASTNANAAASASASANADATTAAVAEASAQAAAFADATSEGSAAADPSAEAAAQSAATATSSTAATADATSATNANAAVAAQAAAQADASDDTAAQASAVANANASSAADAAAIANSSTDASSEAAATSQANTNASASAAASAQADDDSNASAQAAAEAAALADATSSASAAADVTANAAAQAAATDDASTDASTTATTDANASAAAAAQAAAQNDATSTSAADSSASADADPNASAAAAANASASATASASAAADASAEAAAEASSSATAEASASADADADPAQQLGIRVVVPVIERGEQQTAIGTGFRPGEVVTGVMTSDPLALGTQVANAQGTVSFTWTIPADNDLGTHTVTLTGPTSGSISTTFQVVATGLATTGGEVQGGWIALAALLLMLGLGTMRLARSRRPLVDTE